MKFIISESQLNEIKTRPNKTNMNNSGTSTVYLGSNIVKKVAKDSQYSDTDLYVFGLMNKYPEIFPKTVVKNTRNGVVVVQEKLNTKQAEEDYNEISQNFYVSVGNNFRAYLELIARFGWHEQSNDYKLCKSSWNTDLFSMFNSFVQIAIKLNTFYHYESDKFIKLDFDLHDENFGYDSNGGLLCLDFITQSTKIKED